MPVPFEMAHDVLIDAPAQLAAQSRVSAAAVVHDGPAAEETHEEAHVSRCVVVQRAYIDGGGMPSRAEAARRRRSLPGRLCTHTRD